MIMLSVNGLNNLEVNKKKWIAQIKENIIRIQ